VAITETEEVASVSGFQSAGTAQHGNTIKLSMH